MGIAALGWSLWALIVWIVGTRLMPDPNTRATLPQLLRPMAFGAAPAVGAVLGVIPVLGIALAAIAFLWAVLATIVAIRQTLHYPSTASAGGVFLAATLLFVIVGAVLRALLVSGAS